jgi:two-component system CheB/CheR fusion protein
MRGWPMWWRPSKNWPAGSQRTLRVRHTPAIDGYRPGFQDRECNREDMRPVAKSNRPRLFAIQAQHGLPSHRATHGMHQIDGIAGYLRYMQENPQETTLLFKELLIGVTNFFRDPEAWDHLKKVALPALLAERATGGVLRAWVPGCSTGEEAYSLAMVFKEVLAEVRPAQSYSLQVFATDLHKDSIERARQGKYPTNIASDVSAERLARFFVKEEGGYRVRQEIRESVVFATQNIIMDPPFTKLDILSCRNLLIYLAPELQAKLLPLFHYSLNPGGILFLGSAETLGRSPISLLRRAAKPGSIAGSMPSPRPSVEFPASFPCAASLRGPGGGQGGTASQSANAGCASSCSSATRPPPCLPTRRETSCMSVGVRANTLSRRPAKPTGTSMPWPAMDCATSLAAPSRKPCEIGGAEKYVCG